MPETPQQPPPVSSSVLPSNWQETDALESYHVAMRAIGEMCRAGEPVPTWMRSRKPTP